MGVLLIFGAPEHGRTILLADMEELKFPQYSGLPGAPHWHLGPTLTGPLYFG